MSLGLQVKRILLGVLIGMILTVTFYEGRRYWMYHREMPDLEAINALETAVQHWLPGSSSVEVAVSSIEPPKDGNHRQWHAWVTYAKDGELRQFETEIGYRPGMWAVPGEPDLLLLDRDAKVKADLKRQ